MSSTERAPSEPRTISRRHLTRGAAWAAPAIVVGAAAPAYAVSPRCLVTTTIDWTSWRFRRISGTQATYTSADPDGSGPLQPLVLTVATASIGSNTRLGSQKFNDVWNNDPNACNCNDNLRVAGSSVGGDRGLTLHQSPYRNANKTTSLRSDNKTVTRFSFSAPLTGLSFSILDIDSQYGDYHDAVAVVSSTPYTYSKTASATRMLGRGTTSDPFRMRSNDDPVADSGTAGNVELTFTQEVQSFDLHYWNISDAYSTGLDGDQRIFLGDMTLTYNACI